jgi:hypothetical protein
MTHSIPIRQYKTTVLKGIACTPKEADVFPDSTLVSRRFIPYEPADFYEGVYHEHRI